MKTLTKAAAEKKLAKLTVKSDSNPCPVAKNSKGYHFCKAVIDGQKEIRPVYTIGRGRFCSNQDDTEYTKMMLNKLGIEFVFSNDAPKGGLTGNLITITTKIR